MQCFAWGDHRPPSAHLSARSLTQCRFESAPAQGLAALTENFPDWAGYLLQTLHRTIANSGDATMAALEQEVLAYPNVAALAGAWARSFALQICTAHRGQRHAALLTVVDDW